MSREYARRSKGGGNLPLIIAIVGTVIVVAVVLFFLFGNGGGGILGNKATPTPTLAPITPVPNTPTPGPSNTPTPAPTVVVVLPSESPSAAVIVTNSPTPTPQKTYPQAKVWANSLNVREGPGLDYAKIGSVKYGQTFKVWEEAYHFVKIQLTSGAYGWIHTDYVVRGDAALPAAPSSPPEPSFMSKAEFTGSNTIRVTFTENVWGNSAKTDKVPASVFTVKEGTAAVSVTGISDCAGGTYVDLTVGNTSGGTVTVSLAKNGVYNGEAEGTPEGSYSIGTSSDTVKPTVSFSRSANLVTATFSEKVVNSSGGSLTGSTGAFTASATGRTCTVTVTQTGDKVLTILIEYSPAVVSGESAQTTLYLNSSQIYDVSNNACGSTNTSFLYEVP